MRKKIANRNERGAALTELAVGGLIFFILVFAVLEFSRLLWTHNALADATRRGARFAVTNLEDNRADPDNTVRNFVVYGIANPTGSEPPLVSGLATSNVVVAYSSDFGSKLGSVTVTITNFQFNFNIPLIGGSLTMPAYRTTLTGESAGFEPAPL